MRIQTRNPRNPSDNKQGADTRRRPAYLSDQYPMAADNQWHICAVGYEPIAE